MRLRKDQLIPSDTERLTFRFLEDGDVEIWKDFVTSDEAMEFFTFPKEEEQSRVWVERQMKRNEDGLGGMLAVCLKETGEFLGQAGLLIQDLNGEEVLEVGYSFLPKHWRNGYASEAAGALYEHGFKQNLSEFIVSVIHVDNKASKKVAKRNGLKFWKTATWKELPVEVFRINNEK